MAHSHRRHKRTHHFKHHRSIDTGYNVFGLISGLVIAALGAASLATGAGMPLLLLLAGASTAAITASALFRPHHR